MRREVPPEPGSHHDHFQQLAIMRIQDRMTAEERGLAFERIDRSYGPGETRPEPDAEPDVGAMVAFSGDPTDTEGGLANVIYALYERDGRELVQGTA